MFISNNGEFNYHVHSQEEENDNGQMSATSPCTPTDQIGRKPFEFPFPGENSNQETLPNCPPTPTKTPARTRRKPPTAGGANSATPGTGNGGIHAPTPLFLTSDRKRKHGSRAKHHTTKWHSIHQLSAESFATDHDSDSNLMTDCHNQSHSSSRTHSTNGNTNTNDHMMHQASDHDSDAMVHDDSMDCDSPPQDSGSHHAPHKTRKLFHGASPGSTAVNEPSAMDLSGIHATNSSFSSTPFHARPSPRSANLQVHTPYFHESSSDEQSFESDDDDDHMMHDRTPPKSTHDQSFNKSFDGEFHRVPCRLTNSVVHDNPFSPERQRRHSTSPARDEPVKPKGRPMFSSASNDHEHMNPPILEGYFSRYYEDFEEISILGTGSFGKVTKCKNRFDGMYYAIKQTSRPLKGEKHEASVLREVHALATLVDNPYIVRYYSAWIEDSRLFLQTELCEQGNLYNKFALKEQFSESQLLDLLRQVANGLHLMHSASLVHLDIKPENIYITGDNTYKIGDLGLVASCWERDRDLIEGDCRYLCKEILNEEDIHDLSKVDIFALGISLYELALGVRLPENRQEWQDIRAGKLDPFPNRFSHEFASLVRQMMDVDPSKRPSALELIHHPLVDNNKPSYEELYKKNKELEERLALFQRELEDKNH